MGIYSVVNPSGKRRYGISYSYFDENGEKKWKRKIIGTKKDAEAEQEKIKRGDLLRGIFADLTRQKIPSMNQMCDQFWKGYGKELKAVSTTKSFLKAFKKQWGDRSINEIDRATVSAYAKKLLDNGRAIGTVRRQLGLLRFIYAWTAQQLNIELENPAEKVLKFLSPEVRRKLRNETNQRILQYFTEDEFRRMVEVCNDDERRVILWAYLSLMRKSEILNARWEDIDQDRKVLRIPFTKTEIPREIPFRGELHNILDELGWKDAGPIFKRVWLFRPEGFYRLLKKAGIEKAPQKGFHRLRHSGATHLLKIGVNPLVVQKIGGWTDPKILFQTYAHLGQNIGDKAAAIEALGNYSLQILYRSSEEPITQPTEITSPFPS